MTKELQRLKRDIAEARAAIAASRASTSLEEMAKSRPRPTTRHESLPSVSKTLTWALLTRNQFGTTAAVPQRLQKFSRGPPPPAPPLGPPLRFPHAPNPIGWDEEPLTFDGDQQKTDRFLHEYHLYQFVNTTHPIMMNPWQKVTHALTYVDGPDIYEWKRSAENWILSIPAPSTPNQMVYEDFEEEFIKSWTNTNEPYRAAAELDKLPLRNENINEYITTFTELACKVLYHKDNPTVLEKFKAGLPLKLLKLCMHHNNPRNWEAWMRSTCACQAILTSLESHQTNKTTPQSPSPMKICTPTPLTTPPPMPMEIDKMYTIPTQ